jgi:RNA polymerase sigma factor (TIGR02999 family)
MTEPEVGETTLLLRRISAGDLEARERLIEIVYGELRRIAAHHLKGSPERTLQPTALVHEAWLRLCGVDVRDFESRTHFLGFASRAMRSVLVDHVRARRAEKRAPEEAASPLDETVAYLEAGEIELLDLDEALKELERDDPELARLVELRFFAGLGHAEIAGVLGCSLSTVERSWRLARARLHASLGDASSP